MPIVIVDGQEIELDASERLNGIQVARRIGVEVPHYCWHPGLSVVASCRMCLVETGRKDPATGKITMTGKLSPACQTPATDNTVFVTNSPLVLNARAMVEEDLLIRHPIDCPICDKAGECSLQDYHFEHGRDQRRADLKPFTSRRRPLGDTVTVFVDRCVMCTRCVRFTKEISGTKELMVINRGAHEEIDVFPGYPLENKLSGNVVDLCPVGALGDKDFLYQQRVWFMKSHANVCAGCSTGCAINVEENQDQIYRLKPRENPHVNQWWMCDEGRYGWKHVHAQQRLTEPRRRDKDVYAIVEWSDLPAELDKKLRAAVVRSPLAPREEAFRLAERDDYIGAAGKLAVALSPHLTVEEAYLLAKYIRSIDSAALVGVGPIPTQGQDERFTNGFTIRAEKCPNRKGVEAVASAMNGGLVGWSDFVAKVQGGSYQAAWITGGYKSDWNDAATAEKFSDVKTLIVQDLFASHLTDAATYQLPCAAFAEREGSYVNFADRLQSFRWAIRPPSGVKVDGHLFWQLLEMPGLYNARIVLDEVSREIGYFSAAMDTIPNVGIDLKINQLAAV